MYLGKGLICPWQKALFFFNLYKGIIRFSSHKPMELICQKGVSFPNFHKEDILVVALTIHILAWSIFFFLLNFNTYFIHLKTLTLLLSRSASCPLFFKWIQIGNRKIIFILFPYLFQDVVIIHLYVFIPMSREDFDLPKEETCLT